MMSEPMIVAFINTTRENLEVQDIWQFIMKSRFQENVGGSTQYLEPCPELPEGAIVVTRRVWDQQQVKAMLLKHLSQDFSEPIRVAGCEICGGKLDQYQEFCIKPGCPNG